MKGKEEEEEMKKESRKNMKNRIVLFSILGAIGLFFLSLVLSSVLSSFFSVRSVYSQGFMGRDETRNLIRMTVDGFESPEEWIAKFSKYRSKNWESDLSKEYEPSSRWIRWLSGEKFDSEVLVPSGVQKNVNLQDTEKGILALRGRWNFSGYNWMAIEPNAIRPAKQALLNWLRLVTRQDQEGFKPLDQNWKEENHSPFIWLSGQVQELFVYVWGSNYDYELELHLQDYKGDEHILPVGNLNYRGWKNLRIPIPSYIPQTDQGLPGTRPLKFLRFVIRSNPNEENLIFYAYMDYFHALTDIYEPRFFGEELQFVQKYWSESE